MWRKLKKPSLNQSHMEQTIAGTKELDRQLNNNNFPIFILVCSLYILKYQFAYMFFLYILIFMLFLCTQQYKIRRWGMMTKGTFSCIHKSSVEVDLTYCEPFYAIYTIRKSYTIQFVIKGLTWKIGNNLN